MADFPSRLDLYALGRNYVVQRATKIDPAQVDVLGSDVNIFVGSTSVVAYSIILQLVYAFNRLLLDGATGDDLDRYAWDRYQLTRFGAVSAVGSVTFTRPTNGAGAGSIPIGTILLTNQGFEYITTTVATFATNDLSATASVRATQAGKATQVGANQIRKFSDIGSLFDSTLGVNNPAATAGGEDQEDDDTFRNRIRNFWNTARRGTLSAIENGATSTPGVVSAQAIEAVNNVGMPARVVNLYIADSSGVASNELATAVSQNLLDYRAAGIAVVISNSLPQIVNIQLALTFQAGVDTASLSDSIQAAVVNYVNSLSVNGTLYLSALYTVLQRFSTDGLIVTQGSVVTPTGDLVPSLGSTLRTTLANVSF